MFKKVRRGTHRGDRAHGHTAHPARAPGLRRCTAGTRTACPRRCTSGCLGTSAAQGHTAHPARAPGSRRSTAGTRTACPRAKCCMFKKVRRGTHRGDRAHGHTAHPALAPGSRRCTAGTRTAWGGGGRGCVHFWPNRRLHFITALHFIHKVTHMIQGSAHCEKNAAPVQRLPSNLIRRCPET